jgi:EAL domain-containing protein (putative c-di-GMP-specific phosphodiesterase class I)
MSLLEAPGGSGAAAKMLAADLKHLMQSRDCFRIYYQPQYDREEHCIGAEALLRWFHPVFGLIYPPLLIGIAAEIGILKDVEKTIFEIVAQDMQVMYESGELPKKISVNVTAQTLQDENFPAFLDELLQEYPCLRSRLCVELTEQMSFTMDPAMEGCLSYLQEQGVQFAIDDFSMGHTSLQYLQSNYFSLVKLDGSLIRGILENRRSEDIVASLLNMAESMDFFVVAEYVETREQREKLMELGCHYYQGYLYSAAVVFSDFAALHRKDRAGEPLASGA